MGSIACAGARVLCDGVPPRTCTRCAARREKCEYRHLLDRGRSSSPTRKSPPTAPQDKDIPAESKPEKPSSRPESPFRHLLPSPAAQFGKYQLPPVMNHTSRISPDNETHFDPHSAFNSHSNPMSGLHALGSVAADAQLAGM